MTHEHVVPEALGGRHILKASSCEPCRAKLNNEVDDPYLSGVMIGPRSLFPIAGRKPPKTRDLKVTKYAELPDEGREMNLDWVRIPIGEFPPMVAMAGLDPPGIFTGRQDLKSARLRALRIYTLPSFRQRSEELTAKGMMPMGPEGSFALARMACKSAHAYAHYVLGTEGFEPLLLDVIHGRDEHVLRYFGGGEKKDLAAAIALDGAPYGIRLRYQGGYVIVDLQIFAEYGMPTYQVVTGKRPNFEEHAAARVEAAFAQKPTRRGRRRQRH